MMDICYLLFFFFFFAQHNILGIELKWQTILQRSLADEQVTSAVAMILPVLINNSLEKLIFKKEAWLGVVWYSYA